MCRGDCARTALETPELRCIDITVRLSRPDSEFSRVAYGGPFEYLDGWYNPYTPDAGTTRKPDNLQVKTWYTTSIWPLTTVIALTRWCLRRIRGIRRRAFEVVIGGEIYHGEFCTMSVGQSSSDIASRPLNLDGWSRWGMVDLWIAFRYPQKG